MENVKLPTQKDVISKPKDEIVDTVLLTSEIKTWRDIIALEHQPKFVRNSKDQNENVLDNKNIVIKFEYKYKDITHNDELVLSYSASPTSGSQLGKLLQKYGDLEPGLEFKVRYDDKSKPKVQ